MKYLREREREGGREREEEGGRGGERERRREGEGGSDKDRAREKLNSYSMHYLQSEDVLKIIFIIFHFIFYLLQKGIDLFLVKIQHYISNCNTYEDRCEGKTKRVLSRKYFDRYYFFSSLIS